MAHDTNNPIKRELDVYKNHLQQLTKIMTQTLKGNPEVTTIMTNLTLLTIQVNALTRYLTTTGQLDGELFAKISNEVFNETISKLPKP